MRKKTWCWISVLFFSLDRDRCKEKSILYAISTFSLPTKSWFWIRQLSTQWVFRIEHLVSDSDSWSSIIYRKVSSKKRKAFIKEKSFLIGRFLSNEASAKEMHLRFRFRDINNQRQRSKETAESLKNRKLFSEWSVSDQWNLCQRDRLQIRIHGPQ